MACRIDELLLKCNQHDIELAAGLNHAMQITPKVLHSSMLTNLIHLTCDIGLFLCLTACFLFFCLFSLNVESCCNLNSGLLNGISSSESHPISSIRCVHLLEKVLNEKCIC